MRERVRNGVDVRDRLIDGLGVLNGEEAPHPCAEEENENEFHDMPFFGLRDIARPWDGERGSR